MPASSVQSVRLVVASGGVAPSSYTRRVGQLRTSGALEALEVSSGYLLDQVRLARRLFDFVDALIVVAVTQANVELILRHPDLQRAYAAYDAPPPDHLRRSISVNALAHSLRLPFETTRRRVARLTRLGILKTGPAGVWTPVAQVRSPHHRRVAEAGYARILALRGRLAHLPELQDLPQGPPWSGPPPLRAVARVSGTYLLRLVDVLTAELGAPLDAAVWLEILRSNAAEAGPPRAGRAGVRVPVRTAVLAKRLGLPAETARRRTAHLVSRSACELTSAGVLISESALLRPEFVRVAERNLADLRRMFAALAELGALADPQAAPQVAA